MAIKKRKEEKFIVPGWMVSFSDMIVNLMCFFILLNSYAARPESGFDGSGSGAYSEALVTEGRPGVMPAGKTLVPLAAKGARYDAPKLDPLARENWTKHTLATISDEFDRLAHSKSRIDDQKRTFPIPLGVSFSPGSAKLTGRDKRNLEILAPSIAQRKETLEVVGACSDDEGEGARDRWELSFERATAVVDHLARAGVPTERMRPIGVGTSPPDSLDALADVEKTAARRVALRWRLEPR
jgi:chemotaxis protein MotB